MMNCRLVTGSLSILTLVAILSTSAAAKDDWEYWDRMCAPKCATAGPDGYPDGGCSDALIAKPTLADRQRTPERHVYNEMLTKELIAKKAISKTPVKATAAR